ncbi:MAG: hypothetical protein JW750_05930 [Anaerolineaceae bacterium]|nr:hypothetical protein [Anaerolineaceae bacterium]
MLFLALILSISASACSPVDLFTPTPTPAEVIEVDPLFWDLYVTLGGIETLGKPLEALTPVDDGRNCQTMMNAVLCHDPRVQGLDAFQLKAVVVDHVLVPSALTDLPQQEGDKLINGHVIYPAFVPLYDQLFGTRFTGQPLTEAWTNHEKNRVEQYFENVIMIHDLSLGEEGVQLLPVGLIATEQSRSDQTHLDLAIPLASPFSSFLAGAHGVDFGEPLSRPFLTDDGLLMQVFRDVVVVAPQGRLDQARLYPLAPALRKFQMEPIDQVYSTDRGVIFYPVDGGKGYHVPIVFDEFISRHGGRLVSGDPIAEVGMYQDGIVQQCFTNYCLNLAQDEAGNQQVEMAALGAVFLERALQAGNLSEQNVLSSFYTRDRVQLRLSEQHSQIQSGMQQTIFAVVSNRLSGDGIAGLEGMLYLTMPDGTVHPFELPLTNESGAAWLQLPVLDGAKHGDLISYTVCLTMSTGEPDCAQSAFLVWDGD